MSEGTIRPEALANELGVSGKLVRAYLRKTFPRLPEAKNTAWVVTNDQANETRDHFLARRGQSTPNVSPSEAIASAKSNA
jgi:hypothetical protein